MRTLGIDYGKAKTGLAFSDSLGCFAMPDCYLESSVRKALVKAIVAKCGERGVGKIVVGLPRSMDGSDSPLTAEARSFAEALRAETPIPVLMWDERLTSKAAERSLIEGDVSRKRRKEKIDAVAAAIMLQSYLDSVPPET